MASLKNPQAALGNFFEHVFKSVSEQKLKEMYADAANNIINKVTGAVKSSAANVKGVSSIRNDVMLYLNSMDIISGEKEGIGDTRARMSFGSDTRALELQTDVLLGEDVDLNAIQTGQGLIDIL